MRLQVERFDPLGSSRGSGGWIEVVAASGTATTGEAAQPRRRRRDRQGCARVSENSAGTIGVTGRGGTKASAAQTGRRSVHQRARGRGFGRGRGMSSRVQRSEESATSVQAARRRRQEPAKRPGGRRLRRGRRRYRLNTRDGAAAEPAAQRASGRGARPWRDRNVSAQPRGDIGGLVGNDILQDGERLGRRREAARIELEVRAISPAAAATAAAPRRARSSRAMRSAALGSGAGTRPPGAGGR